ncbi:MAG: cell envelope integrity protein CreD, partial [Ginsengibacter sp.]
MKSITLALRIWFFTSIVFGCGWLIYTVIDNSIPPWSSLIATVISLIGSLPGLVVLIISLPIINKASISKQQKKLNLILVSSTVFLIYGLLAGIISGFTFNYGSLEVITISTGVLAASFFIAIAISSNHLSFFFSETHQFKLNKYKNMETTINSQPEADSSRPSHSNKILYKGTITGVLILVMLVPTIFINNLVKERQQRQVEVANEVSDKWASAQTLTGPYIYLPYKIVSVDKDKKVSEQLNHLLIIPDNLVVNGKISHELRLRSIYKVLLYRVALTNSGNFQFRKPKEIDSSSIQWQKAKICYGISDFKGIEERLVINFNGLDYELSPGLPVNDINEKGLSAPIPLSLIDEGQKISFNIILKIKGSEQLHFVPLSGDSRFTLQSTWANPSFDGSNLPSVRNVNDSGFTAMWAFNKANLPFGTVLNDFKHDEKSFAFGVTMIQPADGYAKTNRCIKYAILFIGLTFSLFFIIELMQKKAVHPVQYILIGLALIIFYTLLLSISEFIAFDYSYLIAAVATILLVSLYAYGHFKRLKTAGIFASVLSLLYGFTFVLIRLEDTALLIGSIGLFIILAIAMYFSRKINWYGEETRSL